MSDFKASLRKTTVEDEVFTGSGLDDLDSGGTYSGDEAAVFTVEIDAIGAQDTFKWKKNNGAYTTGVNAPIAATELSDGVTIKFGVITGHKLGDIWTIEAGSEGIDAVLSDDGLTLTVTDHSNYTTNTESGHAEADFKDYRKLEGTFKGGDTDVVDVTIDPHWDDTLSVANDDSVDTAIDKDRVWNLTLITVPTYNGVANYEINDCVYHVLAPAITGQTKLWKAKVAVSAVGTFNSAQWDIVEKDDLPAKYRSTDNNVALVHLLMKCEDEKVHERHCNIKNQCADEFCRDQKAINIWKISLLLRAVEIAVELKEFERADQLIEDATEICEKCTC